MKVQTKLEDDGNCSPLDAYEKNTTIRSCMILPLGCSQRSNATAEEKGSTANKSMKRDVQDYCLDIIRVQALI